MTRTIDTQTQLCAVIGNPVEHSLSPRMHNAAYQALGLNYVYLAFRVEDVGSCLRGMRALPTFRGMSVTIPHKVAVMEHLDEIDQLARFVGCVNTITNENGRLIGTTTDGPGALQALKESGVSLEGRRVLFLGSGGAVRAVAFAAGMQANPACITVLGRKEYAVESLCHDLASGLSVEVNSGTLSENLQDAVENHDVIIHGTPLGMYPHTMEQSVIPRELLRGHHAVFDMVYRPYKTRLIHDAEAAGCSVVLGVEMLVHQAVLQFERWTGAKAPYGHMRDTTVNALISSPT